MSARRRPSDPSPAPSGLPSTAGAAGGRELSRAPLTRAQDAVLDAIIFLMRRGEIPTVREVGALTGLRSPATVLKHLRALESAGWITLSGKSRGIRLADHSLLSAAFAEPSPGGVASPPASETDALLQAHIPQASSFGGARLFALRGARRSAGVPLVGAIAAGRPFQSFAEGFLAGDGFPVEDGRDQDSSSDEFSRGPAPEGRQRDPFAGERHGASACGAGELPIDPHLFVSSGETIALRVEGDSMIRAGILDGDYVIIRRQDTVEEGEIAAVLVNGEGTLKRWCTSRSGAKRSVITLRPENELFDPLEIHEDDGLDVLVIGKYVGLVRGELQLL